MTSVNKSDSGDFDITQTKDQAKAQTPAESDDFGNFGDFEESPTTSEQSFVDPYIQKMAPTFSNIFGQFAFRREKEESFDQSRDNSTISDVLVSIITLLLEKRNITPSNSLPQADLSNKSDGAKKWEGGDNLDSLLASITENMVNKSDARSYLSSHLFSPYSCYRMSFDETLPEMPESDISIPRQPPELPQFAASFASTDYQPSWEESSPQKSVSENQRKERDLGTQ